MSNPADPELRIRYMKTRTLPVIAVALIALGACGGSSADTATTSAPDPTLEASAEASSDRAGTADGDVVTISNSRFDNVELRVAPGTTVTFVNTDPFAHTITSRDDSTIAFDSGEIGQDETFEFTFDEPGEYAYFCRIHPTMRAVVIVG